MAMAMAEMRSDGSCSCAATWIQPQEQAAATASSRWLHSCRNDKNRHQCSHVPVQLCPARDTTLQPITRSASAGDACTHQRTSHSLWIASGCPWCKTADGILIEPQARSTRDLRRSSSPPARTLANQPTPSGPLPGGRRHSSERRLRVCCPPASDPR
jgi:hypothetical protein